MSGFDNETVYCNNYDFRGVQPVVAQVTTAGQLPVGTGGSPAISVGSITSPLGTLTIGYSNPNITIDLAGGSTGVDSFGTQSGTNPVFPNAAGLVNLHGSSGSKSYGTSNFVYIKSPAYADASASATSEINTGEFVTGAFTRTMPASAGLIDGDLIEYVCTSASALVIQSVGAQKIRVGTLLSAAAGTATSTAIGDSISLRFRASDGFWYATSVVGTWVIA